MDVDTRFSRARLAAASGLTEREVEACENAGVVRADAGGYRGIEIVKLQLIRQVAEQHGGVLAVAEAFREGGLKLEFLEGFLPRSGGLLDVSLEDVLGGDAWLDEVESLLRAAGLPFDPRAPLRANDLAAFQAAARLRELKLPFDARVHSVRATSELLRRAAEVQVRLFRDNVETDLVASIEDETERLAVMSEMAERTLPAVLEISGWLFARHVEHFVLQEVLRAIEEGLGIASAQSRAAPVVAFVDLCGFTALTAGAGDDDAARVAARFEDEVVERSRHHGGRVVKLLGDGAMLHFERPSGALRTAVDLIAELPAVGLPRCRVGAHRGPVVSHNGDLYGSTVNIAARINDYARPGEVLVSAEVLAEDGGIDGVELEEIGEVTLKGVPLPVVLHRARRRPA